MSWEAGLLENGQKSVREGAPGEAAGCAQPRRRGPAREVNSHLHLIQIHARAFPELFSLYSFAFEM